MINSIRSLVPFVIYDLKVVQAFLSIYTQELHPCLNSFEAILKNCELFSILNASIEIVHRF